MSEPQITYTPLCPTCGRSRLCGDSFHTQAAAARTKDVKALLEDLRLARKAVIEALTPEQLVKFAREERFQTDLLSGHAISPDGAHFVREQRPPIQGPRVVETRTSIYGDGTDCPHCGAKDINGWWALRELAQSRK